MGFTGIGIWEILVILVVILLVLGPNRLPDIARKMGQAIRAVKKASADITTTFTRELEESKEEPKQPKPATDKASLTQNIAKKPAAGRKTPETRKKPPAEPGEASTEK